MKNPKLRQRTTSSSIWSSRQNTWPSSWVMLRTRSRPWSVPLGSWGRTSACPADRLGRALHEALLGVPDREVAVRVEPGLVDLNVGGAVHGLEAHGLALHVGEVHVV